MSRGKLARANGISGYTGYFTIYSRKSSHTSVGIVPNLIISVEISEWKSAGNRMLSREIPEINWIFRKKHYNSTIFRGSSPRLKRRIPRWDIHREGLYCDHCGSVFSPDDFEDSSVSQEASPISSEALQEELAASQDVVTYTCRSCGGRILALRGTIAATCPYCGASVAITENASGVFRPQFCIPFAFGKKEAQEKFHDYLKTRAFIPDDFEKITH